MEDRGKTRVERGDGKGRNIFGKPKRRKIA
jgi:hypothetical protein